MYPSVAEIGKASPSLAASGGRQWIAQPLGMGTSAKARAMVASQPGCSSGGRVVVGTRVVGVSVVVVSMVVVVVVVVGNGNVVVVRVVVGARVVVDSGSLVSERRLGDGPKLIRRGAQNSLSTKQESSICS